MPTTNICYHREVRLDLNLVLWGEIQLIILLWESAHYSALRPGPPAPGTQNNCNAFPLFGPLHLPGGWTLSCRQTGSSWGGCVSGEPLRAHRSSPGDKGRGTRRVGPRQLHNHLPRERGSVAQTGAEQPPPPTSKGPASPLPHPGLLPGLLQHLPLSPAWPPSHLPPSPRPWLFGRVVRVPEGPCQPPASEPFRSGKTRSASDAPRRGEQHEPRPRPRAGGGMATPLPFTDPAHAASGYNSAPKKGQNRFLFTSGASRPRVFRGLGGASEISREAGKGRRV